MKPTLINLTTALTTALIIALATASCASKAAIETTETAPPATTISTTGILDGMIFAGKISTKTGKKTDDLIFKNGTFVSTTYEQLGFGPVTYDATKTADVINFGAVSSNKDGDRMTWQGRIKGAKIKAKVISLTAHGKPEIWSYKGKTSGQ